MSTVLITHACRYTGPDATRTLNIPGNTVLCHDLSFSDASARNAFEAANPGSLALKTSLPEDVIAEALQYTPAIDILYCNQFQLPEAKPIDETDDAEFRLTLETLLIDPYRFIRSTLPSLRQSEQARIIIVTSAAPLRPGAGVSLYASARAGANTLVESLARELGADDIAVFGIAPNYYVSDDTYSQVAFDKSERFRASVERNVPLKRLSKPQEMPALINYLAGADSDFITGQVIAFTGGWV
jgi:NAD(P)-dependent dehydrogenase (short-subunit alcohol dehydrogenase family)